MLCMRNSALVFTAVCSVTWLCKSRPRLRHQSAVTYKSSVTDSHPATGPRAEW